MVPSLNTTQSYTGPESSYFSSIDFKTSTIALQLSYSRDSIYANKEEKHEWMLLIWFIQNFFKKKAYFGLFSWSLFTFAFNKRTWSFCQCNSMMWIPFLFFYFFLNYRMEYDWWLGQSYSKYYSRKENILWITPLFFLEAWKEITSTISSHQYEILHLDLTNSQESIQN